MTIASCNYVDQVADHYEEELGLEKIRSNQEGRMPVGSAGVPHRKTRRKRGRRIRQRPSQGWPRVGA